MSLLRPGVIKKWLDPLIAAPQHTYYGMSWLCAVFFSEEYTQHKKASNHHANLPLEMYSFTL